MPNLFPEGAEEGRYHTADATLWYFHAIHRYLLATADRQLLDELMPVLRSIMQHHLQGTLFNIRVDDADGLLHASTPAHALTWMDAHMGDWIVTPRRGKPVEIPGPLVQRARVAWLNGKAVKKDVTMPRAPPERGYRSTRNSGTPGAAIFSTWSKEKVATIRGCVPTRCSPSRWTTPFSIRCIGRACSTGSPTRC